MLISTSHEKLDMKMSSQVTKMISTQAKCISNFSDFEYAYLSNLKLCFFQQLYNYVKNNDLSNNINLYQLFNIVNTK